MRIKNGSIRSGMKLYQLCAIVLSLAMIFAMIYGLGLGSPYDENDPEIFDGELYICECEGECGYVVSEPESGENEGGESEYEPYICECGYECENLSSGNENEGSGYETEPTEPDTSA